MQYRIGRALALAGAVWAGSVGAVEVRYVASDLFDAVPGFDRWRYDYTDVIVHYPMLLPGWLGAAGAASPCARRR